MHEGPHVDYHGVSSGPWADRDDTPCVCGHLEQQHIGPCGGCGIDCECDGFSLAHILDISDALKTTQPSKEPPR
jgi:hypothetical protein